jgi:hypothetical protein
VLKVTECEVRGYGRHDRGGSDEDEIDECLGDQEFISELHAPSLPRGPGSRLNRP